MKFFTVIFSIYILALSVMPCSDAYNDCKDNTEFSDNSQSHSHKSDTNDICSPFCLCDCCGMVSGIVLQWNVYNLVKAKTFELSKPEIYYKSIFIPCYFGKIWQPPKINA